MKVRVTSQLDRKYFFPGTIMTDPYTEERHGTLYLACDHPEGSVALKSFVRCDAIVEIEEV